MFEIRCNRTNGEETAIRAIARKAGAAVEICDEDPESVWLTITEYPADADEDAIESAIAKVTCSYERIDA